MKHRTMVVAMTVLTAAVLLCHVPAMHAQPTAHELISTLGLSSDVEQRVLNGEFVTTDIKGVSDTDLSIAIVFLVKTTPDALAKNILSGKFLHSDSQVRATGQFEGTGTLEELAKLQISGDVAKEFANAKAGESINLSTDEIAAFNALQGGTQQAIEQQVKKMLLARFQAYQKSGLAGISPYARGGHSTDVAGDLRKASEAAVGLKKYMPAFHKVLTGYPQATAPGMQQNLHWVKYDISGKTTLALVDVLSAADGDARAVVQRQFYVSQGYNAEQAVAGFIPVKEGTFVAYTNHTFTDQVEGFGGSMKRKVGRHMMADQLKASFEAARQQVAK